MTQCSVLLAVGPHGILITIPPDVSLLPIEREVRPEAALSASQQQTLIMSALESPQNGRSLRELSRGRRRATVLVGDLSFPAPYDIALLPVITILLEAQIRPSRIAFIACPGNNGPLLGRAAIHRYGEQWVGEHEFTTWTLKGPKGNESEALYAAADLRLLVIPALAKPMSINLLSPVVDLTLELFLGQKLQIDVSAAQSFSSTRQPHLLGSRAANDTSTDVLLTTGGGDAWETTLEEATLSLDRVVTDATTLVLAFSGTEGLGSAHFTQNLWSLFQQAEEVLEKGGKLIPPEELVESHATAAFDPATAVAMVVSTFQHWVLFSPGLAQHDEGDEWVEKLSKLPNLAGRIHLCGQEPQLWALLERFYGRKYRLLVNPLGWRSGV